MSIYEGPKIAVHSGKCCGIKTIHGFYVRPDQEVTPKEKTSKEFLSYDREGDDVPMDFDFFWKEAPKEKAIDRFERLISYIENVRHYGLVEVALAVSTDYSSDSLGGETAEMLENGDIESYDEALIYALDDCDGGWGSGDFEEGGRRTYSLQDDWIPELEKRGFREVSRFPNINSGNMVAVFHLVMDGNYYTKKEKK